MCVLHATPEPWCSSSGPAGSLQSLQKKLHSCVHRIQGDPYVMGGLGRNVFPPKQWLVNLSFVPFLAKQSSESTVHQSLTRSNLFNLASEILIRPSLHSLKFSEKSGQIRQWWCSQSYPLGLCPRHLRTAPKELEKEVAPQQGSTERCQFPAQESGDRTWMKDGSSWKFCHSKIQQKIPEEGIHHSKEINKKNMKHFRKRLKMRLISDVEGSNQRQHHLSICSLTKGRYRPIRFK